MGRRLIQDKYPCALVQGLEDFNLLLLADGKFAYRGVQVDCHPELLHKALHRASEPGVVHSPTAALTSQDNVIERGKWAHQLEVLMHKADAIADSITRRRYGDRLAVDLD